MKTKLTLLFVALAACSSGTKQKTPPGGPTGPTTKISGANASYTTGEQVIEAALVAMGGRDKLSKMTSLKTIATVSMQGGIKGKATIYAAPPRSTMTVLDLPGIGKVQQGTRDDVAWEFTQMTGARVYKGPEKATAMREAQFNGEVNWKELYSKADLNGVVDFEGTKAYKVVLTPKDGGSTVTRYYAQDTLLPVGYETVQATQMGDVPVKAFETDYKEVNGIKFPHTIKRSGGFDAEIKIDSIEVSVALDASTFDPPEQVKALIK